MLRCTAVHTHKNIVVKHVERILNVPRPRGSGYQVADMLVAEVPNGANMLEGK
jgi:hypothetical protein